jgi:hypothetical protein
MDPKRPVSPDERTETQNSLNRDMSNVPGDSPSTESPQMPTSHVDERSGQERETENERSHSSEFSAEEATDTADDEPSSMEEPNEDEAASASGLSGESSQSEASEEAESSDVAESHDDSADQEETGDENADLGVAVSESEANDIDTSTVDNTNYGVSDDAMEDAQVANDKFVVNAVRPVPMPTSSSGTQQHNVALPLALPVMLRGADAIFMKALEKALPELCKVFEDQIADYDNQLKFELTAEARALWH